MLTPLQYWLVLIAVAAFAFVRGRTDERVAVAVCIAATLATRLVVSPLASRFSSVEVGVFVVDFLAFVGFTLIALRSDRFWPLWVAGFQLTTLLAHILKAIDVSLIPHVYAAAARFWVYPIFLIIVIGTWRTHQRSRRESLTVVCPS